MAAGPVIAVVGAGFTGTLLAIHLLRTPGAKVLLIERSGDFGPGAAYGGVDAQPLLNVRAGAMAAFADQPAHFVDWMRARGLGDDGAQFVSRRIYGAYLRDLLRQALATHGRTGRLCLIADEATAVVSGGLRLAKGGVLAADAIVLALGNPPPHDLAGCAAISGDPARYAANPWSPQATADLDPDQDVMLVGTGLTMIDVALTLEARLGQGRVVALSRHGLAPHSHSGPSPPASVSAPSPTLSRALREIRRKGEGADWRATMDGLRPITADLWRRASLEERRRFLRHLRPWWDVHRHRLAPSVAEKFAQLRQAGRLDLRAGRLLAAAPADGGVTVEWRPRGQRPSQHFTVGRLINCTGPGYDVQRTQDPLLADLLKTGKARPDSLHLGLDVDRDGRVLSADGRATQGLYAAGPLTRAEAWEMTAAPDLRSQVADLARRLTAD